MKKTILFGWLAAITLWSNALSAQGNAGGLVVRISLPVHEIKNPPDLKASILVRNVSGKNLQVYQHLVEGYVGDPYTNLNLFIERKDSAGYAIYSMGTHYQLVPTEDTVDRIKKITLSDRDSIILYYHLDNTYLFEPGEYRVKCTYRNNIHKRDKIESEWAYFKVLNKIFVKHYYEQD